MKTTKFVFPLYYLFPVYWLKQIPGLILENKRGWHGIVLRRDLIALIVDPISYWKIESWWFSDDCYWAGKIVGHLKINGRKVLKKNEQEVYKKLIIPFFNRAEGKQVGEQLDC